MEGNHTLGPPSHLLLCCQVLRTRRVCDLWRTYLCLLWCCCCTSNYGIHLYQDFSNQRTYLKFWCNWDKHRSWILFVFRRFVKSCSRLKCFLCLLGGILVWVFLVSSSGSPKTGAFLLYLSVKWSLRQQTEFSSEFTTGIKLPVCRCLVEHMFQEISLLQGRSWEVFLQCSCYLFNICLYVFCLTWQNSVKLRSCVCRVKLLSVSFALALVKAYVACELPEFQNTTWIPKYSKLYNIRW